MGASFSACSLELPAAMRSATSFLKALVKGHVILPDQLVALHARCFWRFTLPEFAPSHHGFTDVNAAVVDDLDLGHGVACSLKDAAHRVPKESCCAGGPGEGACWCSGELYSTITRGALPQAFGRSPLQQPLP